MLLTGGKEDIITDDPEMEVVKIHWRAECWRYGKSREQAASMADDI